MKNLNKVMLSGLIILSALGFTACTNDDNKVGRDKGVPNNLEDNYTGDADANTKNAVKTTDKMYTASDYNSIKTRLDKLEQEVMDLKSKKVGSDIVGQK